MFDAQLMITESDGASVSLYSPWMNREGDRVLATLDLVELHPDGRLQVSVYHKSAEDSGDGDPASGTAITRTSAGRTTSEFGPLKEFVRYKFTCESDGEGTQAWTLFRMLRLAWFDAV
ncbi:MAG: hypothetical protein IPM29_17105 [Planctomycetes bacterium]|nr:hypothetical protein [Planctomycetota bacterium]